MKRETIFSPDRVYRYTLWRELFSENGGNPKLFVQFICLNPSTADENLNDPTVRRCIGFAKLWNYGAFCMTNLFAFRATNPKVMKEQNDPVGVKNIDHILQCGAEASLVIAAWGIHGEFRNQDSVVKNAFAKAGLKLHHLGLSKYNHPKHPLYLRADVKPKPF